MIAIYGTCFHRKRFPVTEENKVAAKMLLDHTRCATNTHPVVCSRNRDKEIRKRILSTFKNIKLEMPPCYSFTMMFTINQSSLLNIDVLYLVHAGRDARVVVCAAHRVKSSVKYLLKIHHGCSQSHILPETAFALPLMTYISFDMYHQLV